MIRFSVMGDHNDPNTVAYLLSLGAKPTISGEYELPADILSKQRDSILSILRAVGNRRRPLVWVTFCCGWCQKPTRQLLSEIVKPSNRQRRGVFCSRTCSTYAANIERGLAVRECNVCGKQLSSRRKTGTDVRQCSQQCRSVALKQAGLKRRTVKVRCCEVCNKNYRPFTNTYRSRFCSLPCRAVWQSQRMARASNTNWRHGKDPNRYQKGNGPKFRAARKAALTRDKNCCVTCGAPKDLHGHHIDGDSTNNVLSNVVTLCATCHYKLHGAERMRPPKILWSWLKDYAEKQSSMISKSNKRNVSLPMGF